MSKSENDNECQIELSLSESICMKDNQQQQLQKEQTQPEFQDTKPLFTIQPEKQINEQIMTQQHLISQVHSIPQAHAISQEHVIRQDHGVPLEQAIPQEHILLQEPAIQIQPQNQQIEDQLIDLVLSQRIMKIIQKQCLEQFKTKILQDQNYPLYKKEVLEKILNKQYINKQKKKENKPTCKDYTIQKYQPQQSQDDEEICILSQNQYADYQKSFQEKKQSKKEKFKGVEVKSQCKSQVEQEIKKQFKQPIKKCQVTKKISKRKNAHKDILLEKEKEIQEIAIKPQQDTPNQKQQDFCLQNQYVEVNQYYPSQLPLYPYYQQQCHPLIQYHQYPNYQYPQYPPPGYIVPFLQPLYYSPYQGQYTNGQQFIRYPPFQQPPMHVPIPQINQCQNLTNIGDTQFNNGQSTQSQTNNEKL